MDSGGQRHSGEGPGEEAAQAGRIIRYSATESRFGRRRPGQVSIDARRMGRSITNVRPPVTGPFPLGEHEHLVGPPRCTRDSGWDS